MLASNASLGAQRSKIKTVPCLVLGKEGQITLVRGLFPILNLFQGGYEQLPRTTNLNLRQGFDASEMVLPGDKVPRQHILEDWVCTVSPKGLFQPRPRVCLWVNPPRARVVGSFHLPWMARWLGPSLIELACGDAWGHLKNQPQPKPCERARGCVLRAPNIPSNPALPGFAAKVLSGWLPVLLVWRKTSWMASDLARIFFAATGRAS